MHHAVFYTQLGIQEVLFVPGDQCDQCGSLLNASELIKPKCKLDGTSPVMKESNHIFMSLDKLQKDCERFVAKSSKEGCSLCALFLFSIEFSFFLFNICI